MALTKVTNSMLVQPVNHNLLINPSFTVFQRAGTTLSGDWGVDHDEESYGPDRWKVRGFDGTKGTMSESTVSVDPTTGTNKLVVKHLNATAFSYTCQRIEAVNLLGLFGKEMTLSFSYSDIGGSGVPLAQIGSYDSTNTLKIVFEAVPTSLGNNRWTCTFTLTTKDGTIPDPSEAGIQLAIYPNEENPAPIEWSVWETKLEVGSVATPFIARPYGEELALCQRYYWKGDSVKSVQRYHGYDQHTGRGPKYVYFPVTMRASPTPTYSDLKFVNDSGSALGGSGVATGIHDTRIVVWVTNTGQPSAGTFVSLSGSATLDAEL